MLVHCGSCVAFCAGLAAGKGNIDTSAWGVGKQQISTSAYLYKFQAPDLYNGYILGKTMHTNSPHMTHPITLTQI